MRIAPRRRAARALAVALLGAAGIVGLASGRSAANQVSGSAAAATDRSPGDSAPPVPIVDGVSRFNVGVTHSPTLLHQLSGPLSGTGQAVASASPQGVDVADGEHPDGAAINWSQVASDGYKFAFIKATEGTYYVNPYYAADLAQAEAAGLYAGAYAFAVPNVSGGAAQADYAVSHGSYAANGQTLPMELDIEYDPYVSSDHTNSCYGLSPAQMVSWISAFDSEVQRLTAQPPIIYTTADWWDTCTGGSTAFGAAPLWVAAYGVGSPPLPAGWANWTFWQYTDAAAVPGISGNVDASYFNSAMVALAAPGSQASAPGAGVSLQVNSLDAAVGQALSYTASGLPAGLSITSGGLITGTIEAQLGTYPVTVTAANSSGTQESVSFTWTVTSQGGAITGYAASASTTGTPAPPTATRSTFTPATGRPRSSGS